jgi:hypothetical protein
MTTGDDERKIGPRPWVRIVRFSLTLLAIIVLVAFATGAWTGHFSDGNRSWSLAFGAMMTAFAVAVCGLCFAAFGDSRALWAAMQYLPKREQVTVKFIAVAILLGLFGGLIGGLSSASGGPFVGESRNLPPAFAIGMVVLLATVSPWLTRRWWRAIDEHEQAAYTEGANIAGHFIMFAGVAWWVLSRAKLAPDPDAMALIIAMCFVWTGVWFYRKFA